MQFCSTLEAKQKPSDKFDVWSPCIIKEKISESFKDLFAACAKCMA